ncbi:MAG: urease accessory protein UreE [Gammaproteobacteria bacterium]|nr:urease accessory protein UreE [Gammaproteobacteria bacterium]MDH5694711.1 urease accessory protein UreE [Gammaproteobacteria bacterium]
MITFTEKAYGEDTRKGANVDYVATLPFYLRQKSRLLITMDNGKEAAIRLGHGEKLNDGDVLTGELGLHLRIEAAPESVSTAYANSFTLHARACYHLGNRHVPLEIGDGYVRYQSDHVLDEMLKKLGLNVFSEYARFQPEPGAYSHHA